LESTLEQQPRLGPAHPSLALATRADLWGAP
jgi:hypothetical protein